MTIRDYDHWNEEARIVWYQEEGRFPPQHPDPDDDFPSDMSDNEIKAYIYSQEDYE